MPAFEAKFDANRVHEEGIAAQIAQKSVEDNLSALLQERNENPFNWEMRISDGKVLADGYEHRGDGDLGRSFELSVKNESDKRRAERFQLENDGYEKAKNMFSTLPLYSTVILMSPPPDIPIEGYPGFNIAYGYVVLPGEKDGEKKINAVSFINRFSKEEQAEILNNLAGENVVAPTEKDILLSPMAVWGLGENLESFRTIWKAVEEVYQRQPRTFKIPTFEEMAGYVQGAGEPQDEALEAMKKEIAKKIVAGQTPEEFREEWAIMLNYSDHHDLTKIWQAEVNRREAIAPQAIFEAYKHYNYAPEVKNTSCGDSGALVNPLNTFMGDPRAIRTVSFGLPGFSVDKPGNTLFDFSKKDEKEDYMNDKNLCKCGGKAAHFHCPGKIEMKADGGTKTEACKHPIIVGRGTTRCSNCGASKTC